LSPTKEDGSGEERGSPAWAAFLVGISKTDDEACGLPAALRLRRRYQKAA
jgi:hypothetical protein